MFLNMQYYLAYCAPELQEEPRAGCGLSARRAALCLSVWEQHFSQAQVVLTLSPAVRITG